MIFQDCTFDPTICVPEYENNGSYIISGVLSDWMDMWLLWNNGSCVWSELCIRCDLQNDNKCLCKSSPDPLRPQICPFASMFGCRFFACNHFDSLTAVLIVPDVSGEGRTLRVPLCVGDCRAAHPARPRGVQVHPIRVSGSKSCSFVAARSQGFAAPFCVHHYHSASTHTGNSLDKAGWRTTRTRRRRTSWERQSTSTMYVADQNAPHCVLGVKCKSDTVACLFPPLDQQPHRYRDPALRRRGHSSAGHREMGGRGRHLPLSPQLQRRARDHVLPQPQLCLPPQEDLAQGLQAGPQISLAFFSLLYFPKVPLTVINCALGVIFFLPRQKHWLTNCRSWSHQKEGSKTCGRLWRSEFSSVSPFCTALIQSLR